MDVRAALVADPQSARSVKPPKGSFDDQRPIPRDLVAFAEAAQYPREQTKENSKSEHSSRALS
jgi:hypothetical protein